MKLFDFCIGIPFSLMSDSSLIRDFYLMSFFFSQKFFSHERFYSPQRFFSHIFFSSQVQKSKITLVKINNLCDILGETKQRYSTICGGNIYKIRHLKNILLQLLSPFFCQMLFLISISWLLLSSSSVYHFPQIVSTELVTFTLYTIFKISQTLDSNFRIEICSKKMNVRCIWNNFSLCYFLKIRQKTNWVVMWWKMDRYDKKVHSSKECFYKWTWTSFFPNF